MNYINLYNENAKFWNARPRLKKGLLLFNRFVPYLFGAAYAALLLFSAVKLSRWDTARLLALPACALLSVSFLRALITRPRPYEKSGAGITPLQEKRSVANSFPSRHLACASVIATCFLPYFPIIGGGLFALTSALGYTRFAIGWHYISDLFAGLALGTLFGCIIFFI